MSRKLRLHFPGGFFHIILRGNSRQDIFAAPADRAIWESVLERALCNRGHRVHAYCWMSNHIHMALQSGSEPLGPCMGFLASQFARRMNIRRQRSGHLFERRYHAILVRDGSQLQQLVRYIHLNPVRAGMVRHATEYPWSSHRAYLRGSAPDWLSLHRVLELFNDEPLEARRRYAVFMDETHDPAVYDQLRVAMSAGAIPAVARSATASLPIVAGAATLRLDELINQVCQRYDVDPALLASSSRQHGLSWIRAEIALAATSLNIASISAIARRFNRAQPTLSRAVQRLRQSKLNSGDRHQKLW